MVVKISKQTNFFKHDILSIWTPPLQENRPSKFGQLPLKPQLSLSLGPNILNLGFSPLFPRLSLRKVIITDGQFLVLDIPVLQKEKLKSEHIHLEEGGDPDNCGKLDFFQKHTKQFYSPRSSTCVTIDKLGCLPCYLQAA